MNEQLPHNLGAERSLLGGILLDNELMWDVASIITKDDFYEPGNGEIYILLRDQIEANRAATPQTILADMAQDRDIGGIRASEYLNTLYAERAPARQVVLELARSIADNGLKRRAMRLFTNAYSDFESAGASITASTLLDRIESSLIAIRPAMKSIGTRHIADFGDTVLSRIDASVSAGVEGGIPLSLSGAQNLMGAFLPGRVYAICGDSGSGKSALVQQLFEAITEPKDDPRMQKVAMLAEAEMEGEEVAARGLTAATRIPGENIERGSVDEREFAAMFETNVNMRKHQFYIDADPAPTMASIRFRATRMKKINGLDILAIDHLLYVRPPNDRMEDIHAIPYNMREAKALAKDLHIPVLMLMPLKGTFQDNELRRPRLKDVTHPAAIVQNSDVIFFVHRPEAILGRDEPSPTDKDRAEWQAKMDEWRGLAEFILVKRRGGKGYGVQKVYFDATRARFSDNAPKGLRVYDDDRGLFGI